MSSYRDTEYLVDDDRRVSTMTGQERGVLALLRGLDTYTRLCAPHYADPCAATEMGVPEMFQTAQAMLSYAPDTLRRGAIASHIGELMRAWHINPDTLEWEGE